ncbi:hypothetical protein MMC08_003293 [Hypocenomyce scalaris]|nr:hypothetical protein [Hypocenomyce scalaris]
MGTPSITERKYIRWVETPGLAEEPTSTIVLTSHDSHFVDVRILKPTEVDEPDLPDDGGPKKRLEWAFGGQSRTEGPREENGQQKPAHAVWEHWVDSNSDDPPTDEGDMWARPNGDVLERGKMIKPGTGLVTTYEELWRDLEVEVVGQEKTCTSVVLRAQDDGKGLRGMVIRVGGWCQGILKVGNDVTIERWQWNPRSGTALDDPFFLFEKSRQGDWERVARLGSRFVPCAVTFNLALITDKTIVEVGDAKWEVIECYHWSR